eukprot:scaffold117510_cov66-Phaeocystis_antarctica.AAC.2
MPRRRLPLPMPRDLPRAALRVVRLRGAGCWGIAAAGRAVQPADCTRAHLLGARQVRCRAATRRGDLDDLLSDLLGDSLGGDSRLAPGSAGRLRLALCVRV